MKLFWTNDLPGFDLAFSALGRAVWDETITNIPDTGAISSFQCSRSSRMG